MRGQIDLYAIIKLLVVFLVVIHIMLAVVSVIQNTGCKTQEDKIQSLNQDINGLQQQLLLCNQSVNACRQDYDTLIRTNITKKDFDEVKRELQLVQVKVENVEQKVEMLQNNYFQTINYYTLIGSASFAFLSFEIIDIALIAFGIEPKINLRKRIAEFMRKIGSKIKHILNRIWPAKKSE